MKRTLLLLMLFLFLGVTLAVTVACNGAETTTTLTEKTTTTPTVETTAVPSYSFLSQEEKDSWKSGLIDIFAKTDIRDYEPELLPGSFAVGLMDLDFDRSPEVLIAYPGGSMGNIFIEIYSLVTGEMLTTYNAPHYNNSDDICLYVADRNGDYVILAEGAFRVPDLGLVDLVDLLPNTFDSSAPLTVENIFAESASSEVGHYEYRGTVLEKAQYEESYQQFFQDCQPIEATQIQLIHWSAIEAETKSERIDVMAETLILSTQEFLDTKK